jgi:hypothetical protein
MRIETIVFWRRVLKWIAAQYEKERKHNDN